MSLYINGVTRSLVDQKYKSIRITASNSHTPNLFAIWLRSSVVSVLFSVTAETSSLMTSYIEDFWAVRRAA